MRKSNASYFGSKRRGPTGTDQRLDIIQRALVPKGFSRTEPRQRVLDVFLSDKQPLTPAAVHRRLSDRSINLVSVYRSIELFCRLGVLTEVDHVPEGKRYELSDQHREHHHHLVCSRCGNTEDFADCDLQALEKIIRQRFNFKVMRHDLRFVGLCQKCQRGPRDLTGGESLS